MAHIAVAIAVAMGLLASGCATSPSPRRAFPAAATIPESAVERAPLTAPSRTGDCAANHTLEIHYINVGQGASTFIRGPDGTTVLYDFGDKGDGSTVVDYLHSLGIDRDGAIDYAILSHRHQDHVFGYAEIVAAGIDVSEANYDRVDDSPAESSKTYTRYYQPAADTTAGEVKGIEPGTTIPLGCGAEILVAAANGVRFDGKRLGPKKLDENDRSISLLIRYGNFSMTLDGDIGAGGDSCADHVTRQARMQPQIMAGLIEAGLVDVAVGVDVMHVAHHGSQSSTSSEYLDLAKPEVGLISVGTDNDNADYGHPRASVVESVLLGPNRPGCISAPPLLAVYQTEDGLYDPDHPYQQFTSNEAISAGDIIVATDGVSGYSVRGTNRVAEGTDAEFASDGEDATQWFAFDEAPINESAERREGGPFFDDDSGTRPTTIPSGEHDMTPLAPVLSEFERALLALCGEFGAPLLDTQTHLTSVLAAAEFEDERRELRERLSAIGVEFGSDEELATDIAVLWTTAHGFEHIFCGELAGGRKIGGLHYAGRYLDLQERGQAALPDQGNFEVIPGKVYALPVRGVCGGRECFSPRKGYAIDQDAVDILFYGVHAWSLMDPGNSRPDCRYDYPGGYSGVFVLKQGGIRTMYPVVRGDPNQRACGGIGEEAMIERAAPPSNEVECGQ